MKRTLALFVALCAFGITSHLSASETTLVFDSESTIALKATVNEPFGVDLKKHAKMGGTFTALTSVDWLTLTPQGILFGTPATANLGEHKFYLSVINKDVESLFLVLVNVAEKEQVDPAIKFTVKVGEILKIDLAQVTGMKGKYEVDVIPEWLSFNSNGILVGMPEEKHAGVHSFTFKVFDGDKGAAGVVKITVKSSAPIPPLPSQQPLVAKVGEPVAIDIIQMAGLKGEYIVTHYPRWLTVYSNGVLTGTPTAYDVGDDYVSFYVITAPGSKVAFSFTTKVVPVQ